MSDIIKFGKNTIIYAICTSGAVPETDGIKLPPIESVIITPQKQFIESANIEQLEMERTYTGEIARIEIVAQKTDTDFRTLAIAQNEDPTAIVSGTDFLLANKGINRNYEDSFTDCRYTFLIYSPVLRDGNQNTFEFYKITNARIVDDSARNFAGEDIATISIIAEGTIDKSDMDNSISASRQHFIEVIGSNDSSLITNIDGNDITVSPAGTFTAAAATVLDISKGSTIAVTISDVGSSPILTLLDATGVSVGDFLRQS